jgi:hypothetical protein
MQNTPKYPIVPSQNGLTVGSYMSPIIDEDFHKKFQGNNESKKDVNI